MDAFLVVHQDHLAAELLLDGSDKSLLIATSVLFDLLDTADDIGPAATVPFDVFLGLLALLCQIIFLLVWQIVSHLILLLETALDE